MSPKQTAAYLRAAATKVRSGWRQGASSTTKWGRRVEPTDPKAARWCAYGALKAVGCDHYEGMGPALCALRDELQKRGHWVSIIRWNDVPGRTAEEVAELMEAAADQVEAHVVPVVFTKSLMEPEPLVVPVEWAAEVEVPLEWAPYADRKEPIEPLVAA